MKYALTLILLCFPAIGHAQLRTANTKVADAVVQHGSQKLAIEKKTLAALQEIADNYERSIAELNARTLGKFSELKTLPDAEADSKAIAELNLMIADLTPKNKKLRGIDAIFELHQASAPETDSTLRLLQSEHQRLVRKLAALTPQRSIPKNAVRYKGHTYFAFGGGLPFSGAARTCAQMGGGLVTINNREEHNFLKRLISKSETDCDQYWINGTDDLQEGVWRTIEGTMLPYQQWGEGEPSSTRNQEHYLSVSRAENWGFNDSQGVYRSYGFICEWDQ